MKPSEKPVPGEIVELDLPNDWSKFFESRYLHAADLNGNRPVLTIEKVIFEELDDPKRLNVRKKMASLVFKGKKKYLGLNRTNATCLKEMFGPDPRKWIGRRVGIYPTTTMMPSKVKGGGMVAEPCIRVEGSPDISDDLTFTLNLARKAPQSITLKKLPEPKVEGTAPPAEAPTETK